MSRLIIKNLPSYVTPARLKDHLNQKDGPGGTLTDIKIAQKQDGTSRRFAFVGFKSDEEAKKIQKWFDRTFIDTTRLSVQIVQACVFLLKKNVFETRLMRPQDGAKNAPTPRPNKRPRTSDDAFKANYTKHANVAKETANSTQQSIKKDKELEEYMQVMQPRTKKERTWINEVPDVDKEAHPHNLIQIEGRNVELEGIQEDEVEEVDDMEWVRRRMKKDMVTADEEKTFFQTENDDAQGTTILEVRLSFIFHLILSHSFSVTIQGRIGESAQYAGERTI
jgi:multiple RNA-binding domain-containing protein 1